MFPGVWTSWKAVVARLPKHGSQTVCGSSLLLLNQYSMYENDSTKKHPILHT